MTAERWKRVKSLFERALDRPVDQRTAMMEESGETPSIIEEARKLISRDANFTTFLVDTGTPEPWNASPVPVGDVLGGQFQITGELGRGGMGIVYRAEDLALSRPVAIKFFERAADEARAAAALNHPNICVIHETGAHHGQPYIVMELLEGKTLKQRIGSEGLPLLQLLDWAVQVADALGAAHSAGIVHRDIKPANIFLKKLYSSEMIKVLDFGLARFNAPPVGDMDVAPQLDLTSPGVAAGTVSYMSPEQARGEVLDARTDLFSFGSVLYEMATGNAPLTEKPRQKRSTRFYTRRPRRRAVLVRTFPKNSIALYCGH